MPIGLELQAQPTDTQPGSMAEISTYNPTPPPEPAPKSEFLSEQDEWHYFAFGICITVALIFFVLLFGGVIH